MAKETMSATRGAQVHIGKALIGNKTAPQALAVKSKGPTPADCAKMSLSCACYNLRRASRAVT